MSPNDRSILNDLLDNDLSVPDVIRKHHISLDELREWLNRPASALLLTSVEEIAKRRARLIALHHAPDAASALAEQLHSPPETARKAASALLRMAFGPRLNTEPVPPTWAVPSPSRCEQPSAPNPAPIPTSGEVPVPAQPDVHSNGSAAPDLHALRRARRPRTKPENGHIPVPPTSAALSRSRCEPPIADCALLSPHVSNYDSPLASPPSATGHSPLATGFPPAPLPSPAHAGYSDAIHQHQGGTMNMRTRDLLAVALLACAGAAISCQSTTTPTTPTTPATTTTAAVPKAATPVAEKIAATKAQLFEGMGAHKRKVTTSSPEAQKYFDQALTWTFSFNHDEAIRSYEAVTALDPDCAMAWWGIALCNGPHINNPVMDEAHSVAAWAALEKAKALRDKASPVERDLIDALAARYASPTPKDRIPLDKAYADAMKTVYEKYKADADISVLYAESLMDLRPWDLWEKDGTPRPETPHVLSALENALTLNPNHPGACHFYIHTLEASPHADKAVAAANRLRKLVPGSGHMVHMPAHIDIRTGQWEQAAEQNRLAIKSDAKYRKVAPPPGFYRLYMLHNHHFLGFAGMMEGRSAEAVASMQEMIKGIPDEAIKASPAMVDPFLTADLEAMKRFGKWDQILAAPAPRGNLPISTAMWHFHRGIALAAKGQPDEARKEQELFRTAKAAVPAEAMISINRAGKTLTIADHNLAGEIAFRQGSIDEAVSQLQQAVAIEDELRYMEPPDWLSPSRHTLGAFLVDAQRFEEAERVYRADLKYWPENGWALFGLAQCLTAANSPEASQVQARFDKIWAHADIKIKSTCLCVKNGK